MTVRNIFLCRKSMKQSFVIGLFVIFCLFFAAETAMAADAGNTNGFVRPEGTCYTDETTGYKVEIHDDASLLKDTELKALVEDMKKLTRYGSVGFFTANVNDNTTSYLAHSLYDKYLWKQSRARESGTIFLIDMAKRNIYIYSNGELYKTITNSYADIITDRVYKHATNGDYYRCAKETYESELTLLEGRKLSKNMQYISNIFLAAALAILLNYLLVKVFSRAKSPSEAEMLVAIAATQRMNHVDVRFERETKVYSPQSSHSGSSRGGSSGGSSGGGGGHGF